MRLLGLRARETGGGAWRVLLWEGALGEGWDYIGVVGIEIAERGWRVL